MIIPNTSPETPTRKERTYQCSITKVHPCIPRIPFYTGLITQRMVGSKKVFPGKLIVKRPAGAMEKTSKMADGTQRGRNKKKLTSVADGRSASRRQGVWG